MNVHLFAAPLPRLVHQASFQIRSVNNLGAVVKERALSARRVQLGKQPSAIRTCGRSTPTRSVDLTRIITMLVTTLLRSLLLPSTRLSRNGRLSGLILADMPIFGGIICSTVRSMARARHSPCDRRLRRSRWPVARTRAWHSRCRLPEHFKCKAWRPWISAA